MRPPTTLVLLAALTPLTTAHTVFTTLFIDDVSQGDGTCVRMPRDGSTSTDPIRPVTSRDMVCGRDGLAPVAFACPADPGSKLTFEFREYADASRPGALDSSHKGPCAVYLKQVDNVTSSAAEGDGWFKIWDSGYDETTQKWCTEKLIDNHGLLSIALPPALPGGYFLVRPELLALQQADKTPPDPQFYVGCAQLFVRGAVGEGKLDVPDDKKVAIPGHVGLGDKGLTFDIYKPEMELPYPVPGPGVYFPVLPEGTGGVKAAGQNQTQTQTEGVVPATCLLKNANWCGTEVGDYADEAGCWAAAGQCYAQAKVCYDEAPPTGAAGCRVWEGKCKGIQDACGAGRWVGPPDRGVKLVGVEADVPGPIPPVEKVGTTVAVGGGGDKVSATAKVPTASTTASTVVEATASSGASAESTASAAPEATESSCPAEVVSKDGLCGGELGQTCLGSEFGACCSRYGRCGSTRLHCGCGCQSAFGECN